MKLSSIFLGLFVLCAAIIYTADNLTDLKIKKQGILVDAEIVDMYSSNRSKTMKVKYQNQIISRQIPYHYWKAHRVGEIVQVQFLEGERDILLPDEEVGLSYFFIGFLLIFIVFIFWGEFNGKSVRKTQLVARKKTSGWKETLAAQNFTQKYLRLLIFPGTPYWIHQIHCVWNSAEF